MSLFHPIRVLSRGRLTRIDAYSYIHDVTGTTGTITRYVQVVKNGVVVWSGSATVTNGTTSTWYPNIDYIEGDTIYGRAYGLKGVSVQTKVHNIAIPRL